MFSYAPPGNLDDLANRPTRSAFLTDWHGYILKNFRDNIEALGPNPLFFTEVDELAASEPVPISWNAFPLTQTREFGDGPNAWAAADQLQSWTNYTPPGAPLITTRFRPQDEYCEWFAYTDQASGKLSRIVFTAEGPEYWIHLAQADIDQVVKLYQTYVDPAVQKNDLLLTTDLQYNGTLLRTGTYNPFNEWNTTNGVMHLTHPANTLGAEINLAAFATPTRRDNAGNRVTDVRRLACCGGFGDPNRSSDPNIGWNVNTACVPIAAGPTADATLADPVALYMNDIQDGMLTGPAGEDLKSWFQIKRGRLGMGLLAVLEPPAGSAFGLDQVSVKGLRLQFGGQVAAVIDMVLYAKVKPHTGTAPPLISCASHCCMPADTTPDQIDNINLNQPNGPCANGEIDVYPEITPQAAAMAATIGAARPQKAPGGTRRAGY